MKWNRIFKQKKGEINMDFIDAIKNKDDPQTVEYLTDLGK